MLIVGMNVLASGENPLYSIAEHKADIGYEQKQGGEKEMVKVAYDGPWGGGRIHVEADSVSELSKVVSELKDVNTGSETSVQVSDTGTIGGYPSLSGIRGCAAAIRTLLASDWGRAEGRTESEIREAMRAGALHYPHGTVSGLLTSMTQRGVVRRVGKKEGAYAYVLAMEVSEAP